MHDIFIYVSDSDAIFNTNYSACPCCQLIVESIVICKKHLNQKTYKESWDGSYAVDVYILFSHLTIHRKSQIFKIFVIHVR